VLRPRETTPSGWSTNLVRITIGRPTLEFPLSQGAVAEARQHSIERQEEGSMDYRKKVFVDPDEKLRLGKLDPGYKGDHESEETAKQETED